MIAINKSDLVEAMVFDRNNIDEVIEFLGPILKGIYTKPTENHIYLVFQSDDNCVTSDVVDGEVVDNCLQVNDTEIIIKKQNGKVLVMPQKDFAENYACGIEVKNEHWN